MEACVVAAIAPWKDAAGHHRKGLAGTHSEVHDCVRYLQSGMSSLASFNEAWLEGACWQCAIALPEVRTGRCFYASK